MGEDYLVEVIGKELKRLEDWYKIIQEQIISEKRNLVELEHKRNKAKGKMIALESALRGLSKIETEKKL